MNTKENQKNAIAKCIESEYTKNLTDTEIWKSAKDLIYFFELLIITDRKENKKNIMQY